MKADESLTIRIPLRLKEEMTQIGVDNGLTLSKTVVQLLVKAIAQYRDDGVLIDARNREVLASLEGKPEQKKRRAG